MTISSISGSSYYPQASGTSSMRQNTFQALQQLSQALQSGNLQGAQSAFSTLQSYLPTSLGGTGSAAGSTTTASTVAAASGTTGTSSSNPLSTDLQNLAQALQSGNLTGAQSAFAKLQQDASQGAQQSHGHHHHHHHGGGSSSSATSTTSASTATGTSGTSGTSSSGVNVQA